MKLVLFDDFSSKCDFVTVYFQLDVLILYITENLVKITNPQLGLEL